MVKKIFFNLKSQKGTKEINQDFGSCCFNCNGYFCAIVCDGISSIFGSEYASRFICHFFLNKFKKTKEIYQPKNWFKKNLLFALDSLFKFVKKKKLPKISTTLTLLLIKKQNYYIFNIGDTRCYSINNSKIYLLSYDHIYKNYLLENNFSKEEIFQNKAKWLFLTSYLEPNNIKAANFFYKTGKIKNDEYFLLATDGLYKFLTDKQIKNIIIDEKISLINKNAILQNLSLKNGSNDNITSLIIKIK